jgi:Tfp pilus assembly protein PilO
MTIAAISIEDSLQSKQPAPEILGQTGKTYQGMAGKIEVKGSYGQFKQLLKDIRKLERVVNISQLSIKNSTNEDGEGVVGRYSLSFNTYWQSETTAEQVKAGLESRESQLNNTVSGTPSIQSAPSNLQK